mmetsp:Transcript_5187/g.17441  ORF Transcript_5187/g.17441 Transcript_5187/m.17441 type:complete len:759 (+) Transcript_5187:475-2751(+)
MQWVVSLVASALLWSFVIGCAANPAGASTVFSGGMEWVANNMTWFYIGTNDIWAFFIIYLVFSKYGKIKLGKNDDETPEFSDAAWFAMLFTCGVAIGMFTFGVAEPLYYYRQSFQNRLNKIPWTNDDQRAQQALTMTMFHWGVHGYVPYTLATLSMGLVAYRWGRPLTVRSAFYPLIGDAVDGLVGDVIDAVSIACTTFGVCTSLGLGAGTIAAGFSKLNPEISATDTNVQVIIIWVITVIAVGSVALGLKRGIRSLSYVAFALGCFLVITTLFLDNTWYLLNSYVQTIGHYMQWFILLGFECDTFEQLNHELIPGADSISQYFSGPLAILRRVREQGIASASELSDPLDIYQSHSPFFLQYWTIFYWGWWISWSPFVGMFVAKISRGRTIRSVIIGTLFAPVTYVFLWMTIFGSLGIKMQRVAEVVLGATPDVYNGMVDCAQMGYAGGEPVSEKAKALADLGYYALACRPLATHTYDVLEPYGSERLVTFLWLVIIVGITIYFITSSDSGSMVDDVLASGGLSEPPLPQKIFWAVTEGATCTALLVAGGSQALYALRSASIIAGFPYTIALCFMCTSIMRVVKIEAGEDDIMSMFRWNTGLLDIAEGFSPTTMKGSLPCSTGPGGRFALTLKALVFPPLSVYNILLDISSIVEARIQAIACALLWVAWIVLLCVDLVEPAVAVIGWVLFIGVVVQIGVLRVRFRNAYDIYGNPTEDFVAALLSYMFVLPQMELHMKDTEKLVDHATFTQPGPAGANY